MRPSSRSTNLLRKRLILKDDCGRGTAAGDNCSSAASPHPRRTRYLSGLGTAILPATDLGKLRRSVRDRTSAWVGKIVQNRFVFESPDLEVLNSRVASGVLSELQRGLASLGFEMDPADSFGVIALRVVDARNVGTAYLELRDGDIELRIILQQDQDIETAPAASLSSGGPVGRRTRVHA